MPNPIVWHSFAQPNISKSDSLSLLQSKTWHNQISLYLLHDLWSDNASPSLSILLKEIFICHSKSNPAPVWFSKHLADAPHVIGFCLVYNLCAFQPPRSSCSEKWIVLADRQGQKGTNHMICYIYCALPCPAVIFFNGSSECIPPLSCQILTRNAQNPAGHQLSRAAWWISMRSEANSVKWINSTPNHLIKEQVSTRSIMCAFVLAYMPLNRIVIFSH